MEDLKEHILQATIDVFKEKGIKFTMDDIAKIHSRKIFGDE